MYSHVICYKYIRIKFVFYCLCLLVGYYMLLSWSVNPALVVLLMKFFWLCLDTTLSNILCPWSNYHHLNAVAAWQGGSGQLQLISIKLVQLNFNTDQLPSLQQCFN